MKLWMRFRKSSWSTVSGMVSMIVALGMLLQKCPWLNLWGALIHRWSKALKGCSKVAERCLRIKAIKTSQPLDSITLQPLLGQDLMNSPTFKMEKDSYRILGMVQLHLSGQTWKWQKSHTFMNAIKTSWEMTLQAFISIILTLTVLRMFNLNFLWLGQRDFSYLKVLSRYRVNCKYFTLFLIHWFTLFRPTQYATLNFGSNELNHSSSPKVNLMGLGPRHEFGKKELKEGYPGQGAYFLKENPNSISYKIENSPANSFG